MVDVQSGLLDQRHDVAHAENAAGNALGVEVLEPVELFARAHQLDGLARHLAHRKGCTAAAVAVDTRQHDARDADPLIEVARERHRVLARQGIRNEKGLVGFHDVAHGGCFREQLLVDREATCCVEHHDVVAALAGFRHRTPGDLDGLLAGDDGERVDLHLAAENGELFLCGRTPGVERGHQHAALVALGEALGDLRRGRGLARALQADHQDGDRRRGAQVEGGVLAAAQRLDHRVMDDLDDHLAGLHGLHDLGANRLFAHLVSEGLHHLERHVGLEKRPAHFAQRVLDVGFRQGTASGDLVQNARQAIA